MGRRSTSSRLHEAEGRFGGHFAADGTATPEILATREDRLANWRGLQELAGLR